MVLVRRIRLQTELISALGANRKNKLMTKSLELITEAVRNSKLAFRKTENQPKKPLKHRYERRKIREYLHLGDWLSAELP